MADSADYEDDAARIVREYVSAESTTDAEVAADLEAEGFEGAAIDQFTGDIPTVEEVVEDVPETRGITTREDVEETLTGVESDKGVDMGPGRADAMTDEAARQTAAPTESEVDSARRQAIQQVDEDGTLRSNPDLDPAGGSEGQEIINIQESGLGSGQGSLGQDSDLRETVERTGPDSGTFYYETSEGRFPVAEVEL